MNTTTTSPRTSQSQDVPASRRITLRHSPCRPPLQTGTARVKRGMAEILKGGVIMDDVTPEQARIAEAAGAVAVMALEQCAHPAQLPLATRTTRPAVRVHNVG